MRLLRDEQPIKQREPFSFGISAEFRKMMNVFKQVREGYGLKKHILYHDQHKPLFAP
jgi:hypothetical protein